MREGKVSQKEDTKQGGGNGNKETKKVEMSTFVITRQNKVITYPLS